MRSTEMQCSNSIVMLKLSWQEIENDSHGATSLSGRDFPAGAAWDEMTGR